MTLSQRPREVLAFLVDVSAVVSETGGAGAELARAVGLSTSHVANILKGLEVDGFIERVVDPVMKRTYRIGVTSQGRAALGRQATWSKRRDSRTIVRPTAPAVPLPMPVCGPIGKLRFDAAATRDRLGEGIPG